MRKVLGVALLFLVAYPALAGESESAQASAPKAGRVLPAGAAGASIAPPRDAALAAFERGRLNADPQPEPGSGVTSRVGQLTDGSPWVDLAKAAATLILLLGAMVGLLALVRRYLPGGKSFFHSPAVELMGRTHLDGRRYLALVRAGRRMILVGVTADGMETLAEFTDPDEVAEMLAQAKPASESGKGIFRSLLERNLGRAAEVDSAGRPGGDAVRAVQDLNAVEERLRGLRARD